MAFVGLPRRRPSSYLNTELQLVGLRQGVAVQELQFRRVVHLDGLAEIATRRHGMGHV